MNRMGRKNPLPSSRAVIIIMWLAMFIGFVGFILDPKNNMVPSKEEQGAKE